MTTALAPDAPARDFAAAARWPARAAAHVLGLGLVAAVIVALPNAPTDLDRHQLPKETVVHLATWLAVLLARPFPVRGLRPSARWAIGLLLAVTLVSGLFATNGWLALRAGSLIITGAAAFATARHVAAHGARATLLAWCALAGVTGAATGLAQAYGVQSAMFALTRIPGGTFGNRNFMAHFAGIALPVLTIVALTSRRRAIVLASMIGCAGLAAAIVLTRSRAAWIGAGFGMTIFAALCWQAHRRAVLPLIATRARLLAATIAIGIVAAVVIPNQLAWRSSSPYTDTLAGLANRDEGSGRGRVLQYQNTVRLALKHPLLGVGPGNWPIRYAEVAPPGDPTWVPADVIPINPWPSSDWMALLSELGFFGMAAALLLGAALAWRGWLAARSSGERVIAGAALLAVLVTTFIEGSFDAVLLLPASMLLVALSTGALLEQCDESAGSEWSTMTAPRAYLLLPLVLGVVTLRSLLQTAAYVVAGNGRVTSRVVWAARIDPGSYPLRIALAERLSCAEARGDIVAVTHMAPDWPATIAVKRKCGVRISK